ncbi:hypothetical protein [Flavobacterium sp. PL002]|uniref:hypothetical protein n=1 Tax=Flavobacterium sp. PL002 TaxID=1897058 RepID=UPI001788603C|nr:hypothetical protein [Flavobacterium sp. PL002]MBE0393542.1 hypothetical protein [Flavobacterium sp. PL002]
MKKLILSAIMLVGLAFTVQAQEISKNAIGLRLGDNDGFGGEITYQRALSDNNRLELDLGWRNSKDVDAIKLAGLYQWVWNIDGGFNWYAGVGGGLANSSYDYNRGGQRYDDSYTYLFAAGDIGIEYNFDIPLLLSLDFRPEVYFTDKVNKDFGPDIALGIKYQF